MSHLQVGVVRYASVATEIARALGESADCRVGQARVTLTLYEDASLVRGCAVVARWQCVVPAPSHEAG
jgi:hypothetical protein